MSTLEITKSLRLRRLLGLTGKLGTAGRQQHSVGGVKYLSMNEVILVVELGMEQTGSVDV